MTKTVGAAIGVGTILLGGALVWAGPKDTVVGPRDAMKSATARLGGGRAFSATFLTENGKAIYDVIVVKGGKLSEVVVDASTGKAGAVESVTPDEEGKELVNDLNVALGKKKPAPEKD